MEFWKKILLKNIEGKQFKNACTIDPNDMEKKFQVFEVLVTETLSIIDPKTTWRSYPVQGDDGIDFSGIVKQSNDPFSLEKPNQIILGQIKRRANGYNADNFRYDIFKIIDKYDEDFYKQGALLEIIYVLSSDTRVDAKRWLNSKIFKPYPKYIVNPLDALMFFSFWKIHSTFIEKQLGSIFSKAELKPLTEYINSLPNTRKNILNVSFSNAKEALTDEEYYLKLKISSQIDLTLPIQFEWDSDDIDKILVLYPNKIRKNSISPFQVSIYKELSIPIRFKFIKPGYINLGKISIYTSNGVFIKAINLGKVHVSLGIVNKFFSLPVETHLNTIKKSIRENSNEIISYGIVGQGGIGKSSMANEIMLYAQNNNYYTIELQKTNEFENDAYFIFELLIHILFFQKHSVVSYSDVIMKLKEILGISYKKSWDESFEKILLNKPIALMDYQNISNCFLELLIKALYKQSIIIWISDMHWCSKDLLSFLKTLVDMLNNNKHNLNNSLIFLFEGRDADTLKLEENNIFPKSWIRFVNSNRVKKIELLPWSEKNSSNYINMIVNPYNDNQSIDIKEIKELLSKYSSSNPMHIKEMIKYLIDMNYIKLSNSGLIIVSNFSHLHSIASIEELIAKRIHYFHNAYSEIIDSYILLAYTSINLSTMYLYVKRKLKKKYYNYESLERQIGIISPTKPGIFVHEFYKQCLKEKELNNDDNLLEYIDYYKEHCNTSINEQIELLSLMSKQHTVDYASLYDEIVFLLSEDIGDTPSLKCYDILMKLPVNNTHSLSMHKIYFNYSEILIRVGSWMDSKKYLEKIIHLPINNDNEFLYLVLAYKSLGNMYGVTLQIDNSFEMCNIGLNLINEKLRNLNDFDKSLLPELYRQREMLLNRKAVTHWFAGQMDNSMPLFQEALEYATDRKDHYSELHTLYEMGMCQLHNNITEGNKNIAKALSMFSGSETFTEKQEQHLIEVELFISELLLYIESKDPKVLNDVYSKAFNKSVLLKNERANYEAALCSIVYAVCCMFFNKYEEALDSFFDARLYAMLGDFETLNWKIYLNISQTYMILYERTLNKNNYEKAVAYATIGRKELIRHRKANQTIHSYQSLTASAMQCFQKIINNTEVYEKVVVQNQCPIVFKYGKYSFYIMD